MQSFFPSADGASSLATVTGPATFWQATDVYIPTNPDYVEVAHNGYFNVDLTGPFGPGVSYLTVSGMRNGMSGVQITVYVDGVSQGAAVVVTLDATFTLVQNLPTPNITAGDTVTLKVEPYGSHPAAYARIAFIELIANNPNCLLMQMTDAPYDMNDAYAGGICSRTGYWIPAHDSVFAEGRRISRSYGYPPPAPSKQQGGTAR